MSGAQLSSRDRTRYAELARLAATVAVNVGDAIAEHDDPAVRNRVGPRGLGEQRSEARRPAGLGSGDHGFVLGTTEECGRQEGDEAKQPEGTEFHVILLILRQTITPDVRGSRTGRGGGIQEELN
jgi:hypothetical protein